MPVDINSIWHFTEESGFESGLYRVLAMYPELDLFIIFKIEETRNVRRPCVIPLKEFNSLFKDNAISESKYSDPAHLLFDESKLSSKNLHILNERWELIAPIVNDREVLLSTAMKSRQPTIVSRGKETGTHTKTIYRNLNLFWRFGQTRHALIPRYYLSGALGEQRKNTVNSLGRKVISRTGVFASRASYIVKETDKENIIKAIKKHHMRPDGISIVNTYKNYLREYFPTEIIEANDAQRVPYAPSLQQFRNWSKKLFDEHDLIKKRRYEVDYLNNFRDNESSILSHNQVPGSCYEIDATVIDVHIVSKWNRNQVLGRPTLYFLVDRASGMTVGISVSLFNASWDAARLAIYNSFTSKVDYCQNYDITINERDWPCAHIPNRLIADNAEMLGLKAESAVVPMVALEWAGISRPDFKPFVEGRFHTLNKETLHELRGTTKNNGKIIRQAPDPRSRAIYTIEELTKIILHDVLEINKAKNKQLAFKSKLLVKTNKTPTPLNFWNVHVEQYLSALKKASPQEVEARLLRPVKVSVTKNGIFHEEMYYSHKNVRELNLSAIARTNGRIELEARVNDEFLDTLFVKLPGNTTFTKCSLLKRSQEMSGLTITDAYYVQDWVDDQEAKNPITVSSIEVLSIKNAVTRHAKNETRKAPKPATKKARNENLREERLLEMVHSIDDRSDEVTDSTLKPKRRYSHNVIELPKREDNI